MRSRIACLLPNRRQFFVQQVEERFESDRGFLFLPYRDKVDANIIGLQADEGNVVRAQVTGRGGNKSTASTGVGARVEPQHIVQLGLSKWREDGDILDTHHSVVPFPGSSSPRSAK